MKRSLTVTTAALVLMFGSILASIAGASMLLLIRNQAVVPQGTPYSMRTLALGGFTLWSLLAVLGFSTSIGVFQRWRWARYSMISIGSILAIFALISIPVILLMSRSTLMANTPREIAQIVTLVVTGIYLLLGGLGIWFAFLFSRRSVAEYFRGVEVEAEQQVKRPLPITMVAVLMLIGMFSVSFLFTSSMPLFFMGRMLVGTGGRVVFLVWMSAYCLIGLGLFRLKPWAWMASMGMFVFGLVNQLLIFLPGREAMFEEELRKLTAGQQIPPSMIEGTRAALVLGVVFITIPIFLLLAGRSAYYVASSERERLALPTAERPSR